MILVLHIKDITIEIELTDAQFELLRRDWRDNLHLFPTLDEYIADGVYCSVLKRINNQS